MGNNTQARRYILTINNPTQTDEELCTYIQGLEHFKYCMFQREIGHEKGTEHIQMFLVFTVGKWFSTVKTYFPEAHIEKAQGSNVQCRDYCSKEDTRISGPYELGEFAEQRSRTDLATIVELATSGATDSDIQKLFPSQYLLHIDKIHKVREQQRYDENKKNERKVIVTYIYGPPGCGKTRFIVDKYGYGNFYRMTNYRKNCFDFYDNEKVIVFDEFDSSLPITEMLNYLDVYPVQLPCRYSNKMANYDEVYIISNLKLSEQYQNIQNEKPTQFQALLRRIHKIIRLDEKGQQHIERNIQPYGSKQVNFDLLLEANEEDKKEVDAIFGD